MSILKAIGNTPLIDISQKFSGRPGIRILAKLEASNPGGSVKDRAALFMIREAIESKKLLPGQTILEATSGNTGIALAMIGAALGYKVKIFMPEDASLERKLIIKSLGAELILTPANQKTDGAIKAARNLYEKNPEKFFLPDQFSNPANPQAHYQTTAREIINQVQGNIDYFVAGIGSGGTITGCARLFKEKYPAIKVVGIVPASHSRIQGLRNLDESARPSILDLELIDEIIKISEQEAIFWTGKLHQSGLFVGISSGAALAGVMQIARRIKTGTIVTIFPDRGERYLSTNAGRFKNIGHHKNYSARQLDGR